MILQATPQFPTVQIQMSPILEVRLDRTPVPNRVLPLPESTRTACRMVSWGRVARDSLQSIPDTSPSFAEE